MSSQLERAMQGVGSRAGHPAFGYLRVVQSVYADDHGTWHFWHRHHPEFRVTVEAYEMEDGRTITMDDAFSRQAFVDIHWQLAYKWLGAELIRMVQQAQDDIDDELDAVWGEPEPSKLLLPVPNDGEAWIQKFIDEGD